MKSTLHPVSTALNIVAQAPTPEISLKGKEKAINTRQKRDSIDGLSARTSGGPQRSRGGRKVAQDSAMQFLNLKRPPLVVTEQNSLAEGQDVPKREDGNPYDTLKYVRPGAGESFLVTGEMLANSEFKVQNHESGDVTGSLIVSDFENEKGTRSPVGIDNKPALGGAPAELRPGDRMTSRGVLVDQEGFLVEGDAPGHMQPGDHVNRYGYIVDPDGYERLAATSRQAHWGGGSEYASSSTQQVSYQTAGGGYQPQPSMPYPSLYQSQPQWPYSQPMTSSSQPQYYSVSSGDSRRPGHQSNRGNAVGFRQPGNPPPPRTAEIRSANPNDPATTAVLQNFVRGLSADTIAQRWDEYFEADELNARDLENITIARAGNTVLGFADHRPSPFLRNSAHVNVVVAENQRGTGVARELTRAQDGKLRAEGYRFKCGEVYSSNPDQVNRLRQKGWHLEEEDPETGMITVWKSLYEGSTRAPERVRSR